MPSINSARYAQRIIQTESHESPSFLREVHRLDPPLISFLVLLAVFIISKLVLFSVHDTLSILLKNHISIASMDVDVCFVIDHDSHPYRGDSALEHDKMPKLRIASQNF